jgi:hypothetical protein
MLNYRFDTFITHLYIQCAMGQRINIFSMPRMRWRVLRNLLEPNTHSQFLLTSNMSVQKRFASSRKGGNVSPLGFRRTKSFRVQDQNNVVLNPVEPLTAGADIENLLSKPLWSVSSLLPQETQSYKAPWVTIDQLHHLLRLSALPQPDTKEEELEMLATLSSQLHFVREIQQVNTDGVEPTRAIRDETLAAEQEAEITLTTLEDALSQEDVVGKHYKRVRRRRDRLYPSDNPKGWRPLDHAQVKVGKYFVVDSGQKPMP